jgi:coenzyme F420-reducing hydrogenase gamma subunit
MLSKIKRTTERAQFLADVLTCAVEGGINYWASVSDYRWYDPTFEDGGGTAEHVDGVPNAYATVHETESDGTVSGLIGVDQVATAIRDILNGKEGIRINDADVALIREANRDNDAGEIDAGIADMIVQVAMFGEVVYG